MLNEKRWAVLYRWTPLLLLALIALVFANSFPGAFIQDDIHIVQNNPLVQSFDLWRIFTSDYWYGIEYSGLYRPLTILSFALNRLVLGEATWSFHLINLLLHAGVAIMLWLTLPRWGLPQIAALISATLFALHPIHTEVVNEAIGRSELLVAFFLLLALYAARSPHRFASVALLGSFALALLAKENAIVLLAILPLCDGFSNRTISFWRQRWPLYAGMLGIVLLWMLMRKFGVNHSGPMSLYSQTAVPLAYVSWDVRALTGLQYQWLYLAKLSIPFQLQAVYSLADLPPVISSAFSVRGIAVLAATTALFVLLVAAYLRRQLWALFALCYVVAFAPTANVIIPIGVSLAERLAYFPSLWFCAVLGCGVYAFGSKYQRLIAPGLALLVAYCLFFAVTTVQRNRAFASEIRLWSEEVRINPGDFLGWHSVAEVLNANQRFEEAERAYLHLLTLKPDSQGALRSYVAFLVSRERFSEAIEPARRSLSLAKAQGDKVGMAYDLTNLAKIYVEMKEYDQALAELHQPEAGLQENRDFYFVMLGQAYEGKGNYAEAVAAYRQAGSYDFERDAALRFGRSLLRLNELEEALIPLQKATLIDNSAEAWNLIGTIHATKGRFPQAVDAFERATQGDPANQLYRENLLRARSFLDSAARPGG